jgi:type IV pilus assembly protein PilQ
MRGNIGLRKGTVPMLFIVLGVLLVVFGCAQAPPKKIEVTEEQPAEVQSITVTTEPSAQKTIIEITSSRPVPYAAFKLVQPPRIVVGINAAKAEGLTIPSVTDERIIKDISFETTKEEPVSTRVIADLSVQDVDYTVQDEGESIKVFISPKEPIQEKPAPVVAMEEEEPPGAKEPRVFFLPTKSKLNQVLGVDFFMLTKGRSRITVTTSEKAEYELSPKDALTLVLEIKNASIRPELTRYIDSSRFKGIVSKITPAYARAEKKVALEISLKEAAPYHLIQEAKEIRIDLNKTTVRPPAKKITPEQYAKALVAPDEEGAPVKPTSPEVGEKPPQPRLKNAARMTLEFSNADIRNILKLIGEVSQYNIVWGPEVTGTVSMRLRDVPWDQALDIVLETNNLGIRKEGNVIWVTTKDKIRDINREEEERQKAKEKMLEDLKKAEKEAKAEEPLVTAYITVNYAEVEDIRKLIEENVKGPRGRISVDKANKTIIFTDIAANVNKAKELRQRQDKPTKQVLIEARIVEARTSFSRDIGFQWNLNYEHGGSPWGGSGPGEIAYGFATNFTMPAGPTAGITFANTAGTKVLNAQIALAETEGDAKTLSAPKILTRDTKEATIKQGTTIYIPYTDEDGNRTVKDVEANLELKVTPKITPNDMVIMEIRVSDDVPDYANRVGENVPINTKSANTEMMVASGDTVIIGGIYKETKGKSVTGTPWLRKIPFIGWLFKTENVENTKTELLIFLTPTVVYSDKGMGALGG